MTLDELCEAVETRQASTSGFWRRAVGLHVRPLTPDEAREALGKPAGVGRDYDGIRSEPIYVHDPTHERVCSCGRLTGTQSPRCRECNAEYQRRWRRR